MVCKLVRLRTLDLSIQHEELHASKESQRQGAAHCYWLHRCGQQPLIIGRHDEAVSQCLGTKRQGGRIQTMNQDAVLAEGNSPDRLPSHTLPNGELSRSSMAWNALWPEWRIALMPMLHLRSSCSSSSSCTRISKVKHCYTNKAREDAQHVDAWMCRHHLLTRSSLIGTPTGFQANQRTHGVRSRRLAPGRAECRGHDCRNNARRHRCMITTGQQDWQGLQHTQIRREHSGSAMVERARQQGINWACTAGYSSTDAQQLLKRAHKRVCIDAIDNLGLLFMPSQGPELETTVA